MIQLQLRLQLQSQLVSRLCIHRRSLATIVASSASKTSKTSKTSKSTSISSQSFLVPIKRSLLKPTISTRLFSTTAWQWIKANKMPPRPKINEDEIEEVFIKGGGNGGQKLNKTNSKVQLKHIPTGIVISSQATRSREQNRKHARELLAMKIQEIMDPENCRAKALKERRIQVKRSKVKKTKKKYQQLDEERKKEGESEEEDVIIKFE